MTPTITSDYPHAPTNDPNKYAAGKATDGNLTTSFRTDVIPSALILTLAQSMLIRRVRVFTGQVWKLCY